MWLYGQEDPIKVSYYPATFDDHRHCGIEDIMILVCHEILQDQVIKRSCNFMGRNPSRYVTILPSLVVIDTVVVEI